MEDKEELTIKELEEILLKAEEISGEDNKYGRQFMVSYGDCSAAVGRAWYDESGEIASANGGYFLTGHKKNKGYGWYQRDKNNLRLKQIFEKIQKKYFR